MAEDRVTPQVSRLAPLKKVLASLMKRKEADTDIRIEDCFKEIKNDCKANLITLAITPVLLYPYS